MSVLLRFQSTGVVPGNARPVVMRGPNLTIGRGPENDLVLPDPDRQVSKSHCVIEDHNGTIFAIDLSTNGTFLNYSKVPLGRTPTALNDGDVLSVGPYELVLQVSRNTMDDDLAPSSGYDDRTYDIAPPAELGPASHGRAGAAPDPMALLDDAGPGVDFLDSLLGDPKGPKGPRNLKMGTFDPDALLPPLGDDDEPLLGPSRTAPTGPAMRDHSPSGSDAFRPAAPSRAVIPDDWEDDLLAPKAAPSPRGSNPFAPSPGPAPTPAPPPAVSAIPDDAFDDLLAPMPPVDDPFDLSAEENPVAIPVDAGPLDEDILPAPAFAEPVPHAPVATVAVTPVDAPQIPDLAHAASPTDSAAIRAFLDALGASDVRLTNAELLLTMTRLGGTLKAMITGLREILMTRTSIKSEFRIDQTMITVGKNNPLKFSISPEQAIEAMTKPAVKGYLDAEAAATQALDDIKAHEIAMVTGMEAALKGVLGRLDPAVLTTKIESGGGIGGMFRGKKAQYWETYEKMYAEIADQAENDFHDLFSREFAQAYKDQLARLKSGQ